MKRVGAPRVSSSRVTEYEVSQRLRLASTAPKSAGARAKISAGTSASRRSPRIDCSDSTPETTMRLRRSETSR